MDWNHQDYNLYDNLFSFIERHFFIFYSALMALAIFNLFYKLGSTPIYSWDEARHGISAYEMLKSGDYIVNTYGYKNDYWNLKPPLSFWTIALGYKLAGFNVLGLRLFSAVSALLTVVIISLYALYRHGRIASLISAMALITTPKYIMIHSARTGDADSLFVLFFTASMISMLLISRSIKYLYLAGLSFSLAFLTKSWHALNILIIGFLYLTITGKLFRLKLREWLLFILFSFGPIILWAVLRYSRDGIAFLKTMMEYDLLNRSSTPLEGHVGDGWYYINTLRTYYHLWLLLLGFGIAICLIRYGKELIYTQSENLKHILGMILWIFVPLLVFTRAETKIGWYILPLYPAIALTLGGVCQPLLRGTKRHPMYQIITAVFLFVSLVTYEAVIINHIIMFKNDINRVSFFNINTTKNINGMRIYADYGDVEINCGPKSEFKGWEQSDMLSAELYWDLKPMDGGMEAFLKDEGDDCIIMALKSDELQETINRYNLNIIGESHKAYFLSK